jgi:methyltransferase (TIGR00027 family)
VQENSPSRTAAGVAFRRAAHQVLDKPPVFSDPVAKLLLSPEARSSLDTDPWLGNRGVVSSYLRAFLAVRSRVAEDRLATAVASGVRQYVVLGAGLDTFAYRNPFPDLRVFEVDHPRTQAWKLDRLRAAGLTPSAEAVYVPVDFEAQTVMRELVDHGFDAGAPTAVSWLGVVPYLEESTVWATLEWLAAAVGDDGHVVFDYGSKPSWWRFGQRAVLRRLAARVAAAGEPFRTLLSPAYVRQRLTSMGFAAVTDLGSRELNRRYFADRTDGLRVGGTGHVVVASNGRGAGDAGRTGRELLSAGFSPSDV